MDGLREAVSRGLLWLHVPLGVGVAALLGKPWLPPMVLGVAMAAATASWRAVGSTLCTRLMISAAFVGMIALLLSSLAGHPWQLDLHMYFFAGLALLAAYCDWQVLVFSAAAICPGGGEISRVILHAAIIVLETGVLVWLTVRLTSLFDQAAARSAEAEQARLAEKQADAARRVTQAAVAAEAREVAHLLAAQFEAKVGGLVEAVGGSAATGEIALVTGRAAAGTGGVSTNLDGIARTGEITENAARDVLQAASSLSDQADSLTNEVSTFLEAVRRQAA